MDVFPNTIFDSVFLDIHEKIINSVKRSIDDQVYQYTITTHVRRELCAEEYANISTSIITGLRIRLQRYVIEQYQSK
jgi:hypothetical protein